MYSPEDIQKIVSPIVARYGVERLYLFGSYATGKIPRPASLIFVSTKAM